MFTRKRFVPPNTSNPDLKAFGKALSDYLVSLEAKGSLTIQQAQIFVDQGLQFPATQVASTDANNLDDYEEATLSGSLVPSAGAITTASISEQTVTKIGNMVNVRIRGTVTTNGTGSGILIASLGSTYLPQANAAGHGKNETSGKGLAVLAINNGGTLNLQMTLYDGTYPVVSGDTVVASASFRA